MPTDPGQEVELESTTWTVTLPLVSGLATSIAKGKASRACILPMRYQNVSPEAPAALCPRQLLGHLESAPLDVQKILKSPRNRFGLFRQYYAANFPEHDPDNNVTVTDMMDTFSDHPSYAPYPSRASFLLGEWYWMGVVNKSELEFKNLLDIVAHPDYQPQDVARANWPRIDAQLIGGSKAIKMPKYGIQRDDDWEDELADGDWVETPFKINVPFHSRTLHPGPKEFDVGILHHRKLVSVIREKFSRPSSHPHLHYEPYEMYWQPNHVPEPIRVHGDLYMSDSFIEAHHEIQDSPGEPGCELPRVIIALMFSSDGTQLTAFSNAKLWPVYLTFGNESKDRRSKPTCQAFEHVAYIASVSS
jgi:hypothetical protein